MNTVLTRIASPVMKNLRLLAVTFDTPIAPWEIKQFRGAIAHKVGLEHDWFHNHNNESGGFHYRYPLIQYKVATRGREMRPMLLCINDCVEEAHHFFGMPDWSLRIGDRDAAPLRIFQLDLREHALDLKPAAAAYCIHKWQPLNPDNFREWQSMRRLSDRYAFLERLLASHLLAFAQGVGWQIPERFEVRITNLIKEEWITFKGIKVLAFNLEFECPLQLPDYIGLGKGSSIGWGVVRRKINKKFNGKKD
ncbi:MAG: hypothetical protein KDC85_22835 [Saprospiraceae bacterium]|nr:hypothetical protein [Saprospiraceae bacterium]